MKISSVNALAIGVLWGLLCAEAPAADIPVTFSDPVQAERYERLLEELRCLVCQNQSLADSNADLAQDLRNEVYRMVTAGQDEHTIRAFLVSRYGDFVLYKPPVNNTTGILWFGPLLLLGVIFFIWRRVTRPPLASHAPDLDEVERTRLNELLHPPQNRNDST